MSYGKPEEICPHERPGYRKYLKEKTKKARRLKIKRDLLRGEDRETDSRGRIPMLGWSF